MSTSSPERRVVVVTGGAVGIGAAIAEELGRQGRFVVTVDPGVAVDGTPQREGGPERTTAQRIVDAGGQARASGISVTDAAAVRSLFAELVEEFGALDAVVNVAGISRATGFASGGEDDWRAILEVHLDGYLNVLGAALPLMAAAGHGRILGVTSGSGWRAADAGAYSCAKRAVAALTWQIGPATPSGVTVNALSPIAATRMVAGALSRQAGAGNRTGRDAATGGVALGAAPPPEDLGPVGAYLAGEEFAAGCRGQVMFTNGAEITWVIPPQLLEVARITDVGSLPRVLEAFGPAVLAPAEAAQSSTGGFTPRLGAAFVEASSAAGGEAADRHCVVVTDTPDRGGALAGALDARGLRCTAIDARADATGDGTAGRFAAASAQLAAVARDVGPVDAVLVALGGGAGPGGRPAGSASGPAWQRVLDEHAGITAQLRADAAWARAVADHAKATDRPIRLVTVVEATTAGGRTRAQAAAQLSRAARSATSDTVHAFAVSVEAEREASLATVADLATYLVRDPGSGALSGAELAVTSDWLGVRSHPRPAGTISFGGPALPEWLDRAVRELVGAPTGERRPQER
jgi:NAD(P)-dependent dehydrogenase (short-subunit alcohol dehydrogenase family)